MSARYVKVKRYKRGVPNTARTDAKYRQCRRETCSKTATVTADNVSYLIVPVSYCEDCAIEGGVIASS